MGFDRKHPVSLAFGLLKCNVFTADPQDLICKDPLFSILCLLSTVYQLKSATFPTADCIEGIECVDNNIEGCITADSGEYCTPPSHCYQQCHIRLGVSVAAESTVSVCSIVKPESSIVKSKLGIKDLGFGC